MKKFGNILWGMVLIIVGVIFGLNAVGLTNINIFFQGWWTLLIIIPSFIELFRNENKMWSFIWLCIGIVLLLCAQNLLSFRLVGKLIFPFILVMIGISIIFGSVEIDLSKAILKKDQIINANAIFGGVDIRVPSGVNIKVKSTPIFGGVENKTKTEYNESLPTLYINGVAMFGGVEIK